ncbi:FG-GAP repeat domain-containing protein [Streptomyces sp. NPDC001691]|uniref:FG-GAP repeat domain-containing protein n=1 Tax=Streptomyces sp. NPDC001691 TaxID=3364600 RepID=UPI00368FDD0A
MVSRSAVNFAWGGCAWGLFTFAASPCLHLRVGVRVTITKRHLLRSILGTAVAPTLALGLVGPSILVAPPAFAATAEAQPWGAATELTDGSATESVVNVKTAKDGATVALWYRTAKDRSSRSLLVAVRPAAKSTWGAPQTLFTSTFGVGAPIDGSLLTAPDGSVILSWVEEASGAAQLRTAVLTSGATTVSAPVTAARSDKVFHAQLVGNAAGKVLAVWEHTTGRQTEIFAAERTSPGGEWSSAVRLDTSGSDFVEGGAQPSVAPDGTLSVAWSETRTDTGESSGLKIVEKPVSASEWSAPRELPKPTAFTTGYLFTGLQGGLFMSGMVEEAGSRVPAFAERRSGSTEWGAPVKVPAGVAETGRIDPLVGPNGDVTLVGIGHADTGYFLRATTRSAATGAWSPVETLSTSAVADDQYSFTIAADGTVHAAWTQEVTSGWHRVFVTASRVNGTWTALKQLSTNATDIALGHITAGGPDNRPTALREDDGSSVLYAASPREKPLWRDFSGDGKGDLFATTPSGSLVTRTGDGAGDLKSGPSGAGWPSGSYVVPMGDLTGDRCNDLLVRDPSGQLNRYDGGCGNAFTPNGAHQALGAGWNAFDVLTSPGDLTGDGRPDLLARTPSGDLYMYPDNGAGRLGNRVKAGFGWQIYNTVVGAGDLNGDGFGDLLARDASGVLWRYDGNGKNGLGDRVKMGGGWNVYNALVGVGDITGDGRSDLVARDATGALWRYDGLGNGTYGARVKIGGGWDTYQTLS